MFTHDVGVIGGAGHVGLPLALTLADCGQRTVIYDIDAANLDSIRKGIMPFEEAGGPEMLRKVLHSGLLEIHDTAEVLRECKFLAVVVGTPLDEHLNPQFTGIEQVIDEVSAFLRDGQIMILRSTVYPGVTHHLQKHLRNKGFSIPVTFCPERVAQGNSLRETRSLPQIISGSDPEAVAEVRKLFCLLTSEIVEMEPTEAELAKLMTNAWRYISFAIVNQFYMLASERGLDFGRILHGCRHKYPRMASMPGPGFTAGPCLVKDTMQLAAYSQNSFVLGHAAMLINEGLPLHIVGMQKREHDLSAMTAGILGMAFKAESDDPRDSLSYKLKKILSLECKAVLCTDPYVKDPAIVPLETVLKECDILFVATPHRAYRSLVPPPDTIVVDVWDSLGADSAEESGR